MWEREKTFRPGAKEVKECRLMSVGAEKKRDTESTVVVEGEKKHTRLLLAFVHPL